MSTSSVKFKSDFSTMQNETKPQFYGKKDYRELLLESMKFPDIHRYFKANFDGGNFRTTQTLKDNFTTIVDVDPDFYSILKLGKAKRQAVECDYASEAKKSSVLLLKSGYINDELLKIGQSLKLEKQTFNTLCKHHNKFVDNFEDFLAENYHSSMLMLEKSTKKGLHLEEKRNSCRSLNTELMSLRSKIYVLGQKFKFATTYQKFLYQISPLSLHMSDGREVKSENATKPQEKNVQKPESSITNLISVLKTELDDCKEPQLYFTEPRELKSLFASVEMQNLTCWTSAEKLSKNSGEIKTNVKAAVENIHIEFDEIGELIENMTVTIKWEEVRVAELKQKVNKIINDILHSLVCSEDVLKLNICVQDIYDKLIFKDISFETITLMETIENEYEENMMKLDYINLESTKFTQKQCYKDDKTIMKTAQEAAKKLKRLEVLSSHLKKTLA